MLAVLSGHVANGLITILKFIGALLAGSSGMMAETLHSLADTTNQVFCFWFAFLQTSGFGKASLRLRQGKIFLVIYRCYFYFRCRGNLRYLRRLPKADASASAGKSILGVLDSGNFLCSGSGFDSLGCLSGSKGSASRRLVFYAIFARIERPDGENRYL